MTRSLGLLLLMCAWLVPVASAIDVETLSDPQLRARYETITEELRCLVCQNQTIADSNAELAVDLRNQVREMLQNGATDAQIRDYMTARYGDFVLYKPPLRPRTWALWFAPAIVLLGAFVAVLRIVSRHRRAPAETD
jgi:cytochrome c-type biogenesis protein CcmH